MRRLLFTLLVGGAALAGTSCSRTFPGDDVGLLGLPRFACAEFDLGDPVYVRQVDTTDGGLNLLSGSCGGQDAPERVFVWTVPADGDFRISTANADFDTVLYIFAGACSEEEKACSDNTLGESSSTIAVKAEAGANIIIVVDGANGELGSFELRIDPI